MRIQSFMSDWDRARLVAASAPAAFIAVLTIGVATATAQPDRQNEPAVSAAANKIDPVFFRFSTRGFQGGIGAVDQGLAWASFVPGWQELWRTLPTTMNPQLLQDRSLNNAMRIYNLTEGVRFGGSITPALGGIFGGPAPMPGNGFNSDFGGYQAPSSFAFPGYDAAVNQANMILGFNNSTSPVNFSTYMAQLGGLFNPLSLSGGGGGFGGGFGFASMPLSAAHAAGSVTGEAAADLAQRYEALGRQQVAAYYSDPALSKLRAELNSAMFAIAYLDPQLIYWSERLAVVAVQMYSTRPSHSAAVALQQQVASWTNPPNDPAILRSRYNTRILLLLANAQVQQEVLQYLAANPEIARWIREVVAFIEARYAATSRSAAVSQWFAGWEARFRDALAASPAFQAYVAGLAQLLADYPEFAEYRRLQSEADALLPALGSQPVVQQLVQISRTIIEDHGLATQLKRLHQQYLNTINTALAQTAFAAEMERHYERVAGLILGDQMHQQIRTVQALALQHLATYRRTMHDAVQQCFDLLGSACDPDRHPGVRAVLSNPNTATLLEAVGLFYEVDDVFWHQFYTSASYTALEASTRERVSAAVAPAMAALDNAARAYTAAVEAIPAIQQWRQIQRATVVALRNASPELNQRMTRMEQIIQALVSGGPAMALDATSLRFAARTNGVAFLSQTAPQLVRLTQGGPGTVTWAARANQPWLSVSPASGSGSATLSIGVASVPGLPVGATLTGSVTLTFSGTGSTVPPLTVVLTTIPNGRSAPPLGAVDTPLNNARGVTGAIPVTGWALDDIEVQAVTVCRGPAPFEAPAPNARCGGGAQIFVGDAVFVEGARPDVQATRATYPRSGRAGWGLMVLTNMLPDAAQALATGGNGTYTFYMYAHDREGNVVLLGTRTITCENARATRPFGAIDTPKQGGVVGGTSYVNFGWVLAPTPKFIPQDGGTIQVFIDGVPVGNVSYNHFRPDIAQLFPGYANSNGAVGFRMIDTTALSNGVHTIAWSVTDNTGASAGIGSRYFTVSNGATATAAARASSLSSVDSHVVREGDDLGPGMQAASAILGRRGWNLEAPWREYTQDPSGWTIVRGEELDRLELRLPIADGERYTGYLRVGRELAPLPIGSHLDAASGHFTWQPGVGFVGSYEFLFTRSLRGGESARQNVRIVLLPNGAGRVGPQVVIDTPTAAQPHAAVAGRPFLVAGWAADLDSGAGTGISTLHVWAYPHRGGAPIFLGVATQGGTRPDVAAVHGDQFRQAGYGRYVSLASGDYTIAVFAWSAAQRSFLPAATAQVSVR